MGAGVSQREGMVGTGVSWSEGMGAGVSRTEGTTGPRVPWGKRTGAGVSRGKGTAGARVSRAAGRGDGPAGPARRGQAGHRGHASGGRRTRLLINRGASGRWRWAMPVLPGTPTAVARPCPFLGMGWGLRGASSSDPRFGPQGGIGVPLPPTPPWCLPARGRLTEHCPTRGWLRPWRELSAAPSVPIPSCPPGAEKLPPCPPPGRPLGDVRPAAGHPGADGLREEDAAAPELQGPGEPGESGPPAGVSPSSGPPAGVSPSSGPLRPPPRPPGPLAVPGRAGGALSCPKAG